MSKIEVDKIDPQSGTDLELGTSGDTITVPAGATFDSSAATNTLPSNVVTTDGTQTLTNKSIVASQLTGTITPSDSTVTLAKLTATGTQDATTFLRGDNTFAEAGGGKILQVVQGSSTTVTDTSSATFTDIVTATITPSSASNTILFVAHANGLYTSVPGAFGKVQIVHSSGTTIVASTVPNIGLGGASSVGVGSASISYLDSPATTSAVTYKIQFNCPYTPGGNVTINGGNSMSTITLMEIEG